MVSDALSKITAQNVAAFYGIEAGTMLIGAKKILEQGTMTFVSYRGYCFGLTNNHVSDATRDNVHAVKAVGFLQSGPVPGREIFRSTKDNIDFPFDLSVFLLDPVVVRKGGKVPISLETEGGQLSVDELALAVGFPGYERNEFPAVISHPIYHVVGECRAASDRNLVLHSDVAKKTPKVIKFGGMSGGAIYSIVGDTPRFAGLVSEGKGYDDDSAGTQRDGPVGNDFFILGLPVTTELLDRILTTIPVEQLSVKCNSRRAPSVSVRPRSYM